MRDSEGQPESKWAEEGVLWGEGGVGAEPMQCQPNHVIRHVMGCKVLCNNPCKYKCNPKSNSHVIKEGIM